MIPIRDSIRARRWPIVTIILMILNLLVFLWTLGFNNRDLILWNRTFGMTPIFFQQGQPWLWHNLFPAWVTFFTSQFLHGSWGHLLGNMLYLWIFGDNVEDHLGRGRFLALYLFSGMAGNMVELWSDPYSTVTVIGASGAIAGILGAYFFMFPHARVRSIIPIFFIFFFPISVPAVIYLGVWFLMQVLYSRALLAGDSQNVAYLAHIGGFVIGSAVGYWYNRTHPPEPEILDISDDSFE